mgnify:FL=1
MHHYHDSVAPTVTIIVPALNEARNLEVMLPQLPDVHQIIVVDGHSVDDTVAVARSVRPGVEVITQTRKGKGNALVCGFERATGDIIVMFDADGSADPAEIPAFVAALVAGADVAKGSRFTSGGGSEDITYIRRTGNWWLNQLVNVLTGARYTDLCYGYNAFWSRILPSLELPSSRLVAEPGRMLWGDGFEIETVLNCRFVQNNLRITEVGSVEKLRIFGTSNLNAVSDGLRVLRTVLAERARPVRPGGVTTIDEDFAPLPQVQAVA